MGHFRVEENDLVQISDFKVIKIQVTYHISQNVSSTTVSDSEISEVGISLV